MIPPPHRTAPRPSCHRVQILDKTGDGVVTMHDIADRYDAKKHPDVIAGTKTAQQVGSG